MQGMSFSSLKRHSSLIPLFACVGIGCVGCAFYIARLATRNPEVSWNKKGEQEPWKEYEKKQYKTGGFDCGIIIAPSLNVSISAEEEGKDETPVLRVSFYSPNIDYKNLEPPAPKY